MQLLHVKLLISLTHRYERIFVCVKGIKAGLDEPNLYIINKLEKLGIINNVVLDISTNLTILNDNILNLFSKFKRVLMYVSLEGVHDRYEYIRGGKHFKFADLESNIKIIKYSKFT